MRKFIVSNLIVLIVGIFIGSHYSLDMFPSKQEVASRNMRATLARYVKIGPLSRTEEVGVVLQMLAIEQGAPCSDANCQDFCDADYLVDKNNCTPIVWKLRSPDESYGFTIIPGRIYRQKGSDDMSVPRLTIYAGSNRGDRFRMEEGRVLQAARDGVGWVETSRTAEDLQSEALRLALAQHLGEE